MDKTVDRLEIAEKIMKYLRTCAHVSFPTDEEERKAVTKSFYAPIVRITVKNCASER